MAENEYDIDTSVDKNNLEEEWEKQADLYDKYSKLANNAYHAYNTLKNYYNVVKGKAELEARAGEVDIGCKMTEKAIAAYLEQAPVLVELNKEIAEAKYAYEMYNSAVFAMEHKKRALEYLTKLTLNNYYVQTESYDDFRNKMNKPEK
jgi:hypothetical protein